MPQKSDAIYTHPVVHFISFSGAHSVGKSTLISALSQEITKEEVRLIPSCSSEWFRRKQRTNPECKTYDDVNRLGFREEMQIYLPFILREFIYKSLINIKNNTIILCDRWFSDIDAYTIYELGSEKFEEIKNGSVHNKTLIFDDIMIKSINNRFNSYFTEVFIPVSSCSHSLLRGEGPDGKPRATLDQIEWEKNYNAVRNRYSFEGHTLTIQSSSVSDRVAEVMRRIG